MNLDGVNAFRPHPGTLQIHRRDGFPHATTVKHSTLHMSQSRLYHALDTPWNYGLTPLDVSDQTSLIMIQEFLDFVDKNPHHNILQGMARCSKLIRDIYYRSARDQKLLDALLTIRADLLAKSDTIFNEGNPRDSRHPT